MKQANKKSPMLKREKREEPVEPFLPRYSTKEMALAEDAKAHSPNSALDNQRARGRPATGKRSNPDWKLYSHFLRKNTQRAAVAKLRDEDDGRDLSDLLQELLDNWLKI
jgi:hypothetical protein